MLEASFCFEADLNYFLPPDRREIPFTHPFKEPPSIKDAIESLGVPHSEVYAILVNGESVNFSYLLQSGDRVIVYPRSECDRLSSSSQLQPPLPEVSRFVLDVHLGKLASWLRMLGFDTLYRNDYEDAELAAIAARDARIVLTRDKGVLMRNLVAWGYYVRATQPKKQIIEVVQRFDLFDLIQPFDRCMRCNGKIESVSKDLIGDRLPPTVRQEIDEFHRCQACDRIYWQGTHYTKMKEFIRQVRSACHQSA